jgi:hypothetical protein
MPSLGFRRAASSRLLIGSLSLLEREGWLTLCKLEFQMLSLKVRPFRFWSYKRLLFFEHVDIPRYFLFTSFLRSCLQKRLADFKQHLKEEEVLSKSVSIRQL